MQGVPATAGLGSEPSLPPSSAFSAAAADIKPFQRASPALPQPTANPARVLTLLEICTVGDKELRQQDLLATSTSEISAIPSPSEHESALVAAPAVPAVQTATLQEWRVQPGVNGKQITTSLGMDEARHHRRQLLKALALQARGESNPDIDLSVSMLLVGLRFRTLDPGVLEELSLVDVVTYFLQYPNSNVVANANGLLHSPSWLHYMQKLTQDAMANGLRATHT